MTSIFLKILNMSITASWIVLAIVVLRILLKKAPKWIFGALWSIVALRLVFPFSVESVFSLIPSKETLPQDIITQRRFQINSGIDFLNRAVNENILDSYYEGVTVPTDNGKNILGVLSIIWIIGIITMLIYAFISYIKIKKVVNEAVKNDSNIWICDRINTPFILGLFSPKIYIPSTLNEEDTKYVISHETAHIKRLDFIWKPLGFLLLSFYWFNPILWVAYILLCRDIELACDEKVIKDLGNEVKKQYSDALINCSVPRKFITACPLAFGEVGVKSRIKSVLNYKKPALWIIITAIISCIIAAVCFLTNPVDNNIKNIEGLNLEGLSSETVSLWRKSEDSFGKLFSFNETLIEALLNIEISETPVSQNRDFDRDASNGLVFQEEKDVHPSTSSIITGTSILFNADFTEVWVSNDVKPTLSYKVKSPKYAEKVFNDIVNFGTVDSSENVSMQNLINKYPQYFGLSTTKGLQVYVWQFAPNNFQCAVLPGRNLGYTTEELLDLKGVSLKEMRVILSTYKIDRESISIIPFANPLSSYMYTIDEKYKAELEERFWSISLSNDTKPDIYSATILALNKKGINYGENDGAQSYFENSTAKAISINDEIITFYNFDNNTDAIKAKNSISSDGCSITRNINGENATIMISWVKAPSWYMFENTIVLYLGENEDIISILENNLGYPFAGIYVVNSNSNFKIHLNKVGWRENAFETFFNMSSKHKYFSMSAYRHFPVVKVDSTKDLENLITVSSDILNLDNPNDLFLKNGEKYDTSYFETHSLLVIYIDSNTGSAEYSVTDIRGINDELFIMVDEYLPEVCTADMAGWFATIEVEKEFIKDYKYFVARCI